jgi:hypothetical protein
MARRSDEVPRDGTSQAPSHAPAAKRHPLFGWLRVHVAPTIDTTEPADPEWSGRIGSECPAPPYVRGRLDRE